MNNALNNDKLQINEQCDECLVFVALLIDWTNTAKYFVLCFRYLPGFCLDLNVRHNWRSIEGLKPLNTIVLWIVCCSCDWLFNQSTMQQITLFNQSTMQQITLFNESTICQMPQNIWSCVSGMLKGMPVWENFVSISFLKSKSSFQNRKENCHYDHIPFNVKGNGNIVFSV